MNDTDFQGLLNASAPLVIAVDQKKNLIALAGWLVLLALSWHSVIWVVAMAYPIFFRLKALLNPQNAAMVLTREGFTTKRFGFASSFKWEDISDIGAGKNGIISINLKTLPKSIVTGSHYTLFNMYNLDTKRLAQLMNHWRNREK